MAEETEHTPASGPQALAAEDVVEADDDFANDSVYDAESSDTSSLSSSIYAGYLENGRKYQTLREGEYWGPSDEKQFEAMNASHIAHLILDSKTKNPLFQAPIPETAQNILDIGTGNGDWAIATADKFPSALVQGIDLFPPPNTWVPPNCKLEVDDLLKTWEFKEKFDLIHIRYMLGAFEDKQWTGLYKQAYKALAPGGWIEQMEPSVTFHCDDGTLPADSLLASWGGNFLRCAEKAGKRIDTVDTMKGKIQAAGFTNIHEQTGKIPLGDWARNPILKEAGRLQKTSILGALEGYAMFLLTHFGDPEPWQAEEVQVYVAKVRKEIESGGFHIYTRYRRAWAQKPFDEPKTQQEA